MSNTRRWILNCLLCSLLHHLSSGLSETHGHFQRVSATQKDSFSSVCGTENVSNYVWIKIPDKKVASFEGTLHLQSLDPQDTGLYECHEVKKLNLEYIQNSRVIKRLYLSVRPLRTQGLLRIRRSSPTAKEISVKVNGRKITLQCSLHGEDLVPGGIDVDMTGETGRYSCLCANCNDRPSESSSLGAPNPIGFAPLASSPELRISSKTESTVYLICNAKAEPMPIFTWYKISDTLNSEAVESLASQDLINQSNKHAFFLEFIPEGFQSKLEIKDVNASDFGSYLCHVENDHGVGLVIFHVADDSAIESKNTISSGNAFGHIGTLLVILNLLSLRPGAEF